MLRLAAALAATACVALADVAALVAQAPPPADLQEVLDTVNDARRAQHLAALRLDPELTRAAQAQADDMMRGNYFALRGPDGRGIDELVAQTPYVAALLTEKLVRSTKRPAILGLEWSLAADEQRGSLFHPDVTDLGVGLGSLGTERIYVLALAKPADRDVAPAGTERLRDLASSRAEYLAIVRRDRAQRGLPALEVDPALERAAQAHAEALLAARHDGYPESAVDSIADRVDQERHGITGKSAIVGGATTFRRLPRENRGQVEVVGLSTIVDAASGEDAAILAVAAEGSALGEASYRTIGIGLAWRIEGRTLYSVWVACLSHRVGH